MTARQADDSSATRGEHDPIGADPQRAGGAQRRDQQGGSLVDVQPAAMPLVVGERHHPVVGTGVAQPLGRPHGRVGGVLEGRRHPAEAGPQPGDLVAVLGDRQPLGVAQRAVDQGVLLGRRPQSGLDLERADDLALGRPPLVGLVRPGHRLVRFGDAGPLGQRRPPCALAADDEGHAGPAAEDGPVGVVEQRLLRDADLHDDGAGARRSDRRRDVARRVHVRPRALGHRGHVDVRQQRRAARIVGCPPGGAHHQLERVDPVRRVGAGLGGDPRAHDDRRLVRDTGPPLALHRPRRPPLVWSPT